MAPPAPLPAGAAPPAPAPALIAPAAALLVPPLVVLSEPPEPDAEVAPPLEVPVGSELEHALDAPAAAPNANVRATRK
jgi:hypothetical protein